VNDLQGQVEIECWDANNLIKTEMLGRVALNIADVITLRPERGAPHQHPTFFVSFNMFNFQYCGILMSFIGWYVCAYIVWNAQGMQTRSRFDRARKTRRARAPRSEVSRASRGGVP
jgi:hypothetical protein